MRKKTQYVVFLMTEKSQILKKGIRDMQIYFKLHFLLRN